MLSLLGTSLQHVEFSYVSLNRYTKRTKLHKWNMNTIWPQYVWPYVYAEILLRKMIFHIRYTEMDVVNKEILRAILHIVSIIIPDVFAFCDEYYECVSACCWRWKISNDKIGTNTVEPEYASANGLANCCWCFRDTGNSDIQNSLRLNVSDNDSPADWSFWSICHMSKSDSASF